MREAFELAGDLGECIVKQIDGVIEIDGTTYLVEMKWLAYTAGTGTVSQRMVREMGQAGARGIIIANPGYSDAAVRIVRDALGQMTVCS